MIWVTWRQNRTESFITLGVLALSSIFLLVTGLAMAHTFQQSGLSDCLAHHKTSAICGALATAFLNQYSPFIPFALALLLLPILLGAIVGAPLVAREFEQRTNLLVWLQSITRTRWLTVKLVLVLGTGLLVGGVLMVLLTWWYSPFSQVIGSFNQATFDFSGPVLIAATVLALTLGIFAGTLTRRTVLAIFLTLALILVIRIGVEFNLRPNYEPQITVTWPLDNGDPYLTKVISRRLRWGYRIGTWDKGSLMLRGTKSRASVATVRSRRPLCNACKPMGIAATTSAIGLRTASGRSSGSKRASTLPSRRCQ